MQRAVAVLAGLSIAAPSLAQNLVDPSLVQPVTAPVLDAGTYDWGSGVWHPPGSQGALGPPSRVIYDNTCMWSGGSFFMPSAPCEDFYDEGRVPSTSAPSAPAGATDSNRVTSFTIGYCTYYVTGQVDLKIAFWNNLGGQCVGGSSPTPPPISSQATAYFDFGAAAGNPLPGSALAGNQACYFATISNVDFCLASDGDGFFDGSQAVDLFTWSMQNENPIGGPYFDGWLIRADPAVGAMGNCTYGLPCTGCGTGLDTADSWWVNQDGNAAGSGVPCMAGAVGGGTGCYWFGGYPANLYASFYLRLESPGACLSCTAATTYCTPKVSSSGCTPAIAGTGAPSLSNPAGFTVDSSSLEDNKFAITFFGTSGQNNAPFQGGFLCVKLPVHRLPLKNTGGSAACAGAVSYTLQEFLNHPSGGASLVPGATVDTQTWFRDPAAASTTGLSGGLEFVVCN